MTDNTPEPIRVARAVAAAIDNELPEFSRADTHRLLPRIAMAFNHAGHEISADMLGHHARQGVLHLRQLLKNLQAVPSVPDYDAIVARLKPPVYERVEEMHLSALQRIEKALNHDDLDLLKRTVVQYQIDMTDRLLVKCIGIFALQHRNTAMLDYLIEESLAQHEAAQKDTGRNELLMEVAARTVLERDTGAIDFLRQHVDIDINAGCDLLYQIAFSAGSEDVMDYYCREYPGAIDRHLYKLEGQLRHFSTLSIPYVLKRATAIAPQKYELIFRNLVGQMWLGGFGIRDICEKLPVSQSVKSAMMLEAAAQDRTGAVKELHRQGGDLLYQDGAIIGVAGQKRNMNLLDYIEKAGVRLERYLEPEDREAYQRACAKRDQWGTLHNIPVPYDHAWRDPALFREGTYTFVHDCIEKESSAFSEADAWRASVIFPTPRHVATYLERWGQKSPYPLHFLLAPINIPDGAFDALAWGAAILEHGPEMARMIRWADHLQKPHGGIRETRLALAPFMYRRSAENIELAKLCATFVVEEEHFDKALDIYNRQKDAGFPSKNIPDLSIDGARFGMPGARFCRLRPDDIRGLFLGEFLGCCQSVSSDGAECAAHGFSSPEGGFYVIEDADHEIIAGIWAWRGAKDELVFDSLESKRNKISSAQWSLLLKAVTEELQSDAIPHDIAALTVGQGGDTPRDMGYLPAVPAQPMDHPGYEDSAKQYQVWVSDAYDRELALHRYSGFLQIKRLQPV